VLAKNTCIEQYNWDHTVRDDVNHSCGSESDPIAAGSSTEVIVSQPETIWFKLEQGEQLIDSFTGSKGLIFKDSDEGAECIIVEQGGEEKTECSKPGRRKIRRPEPEE